uniref:tumor necrosis factor receptor superfamily member 1B n=1 Tax=Scatophagus argus TaxID=75038 RepID=UPI001ED847D8|nr:tumor necrosis factor receptor superfamily member 1B [Scatophagus argus]
MKEILVLLVLLNTQTIKVCSRPYQADSNGKCLNKTTEYLLDGSNLCCKKCQPGHRLKQKCSENTETVCEQCPEGQYMEGWNYSPNCFSCSKCKSVKGLQHVQKCSSTTKPKCGCQLGMYCMIGFDDPYCSECRRYRQCPVGYGVSVPGMADSDVKCEQCPSGMFSNTVSSKDRCQPHTNCHGRVIRQGNATSDTVCEPEPQTSTKEPHSMIGFTNASTMTNSVTSDFKAPRGPTDATLSVSVTVFNHSTPPLPPKAPSDGLLAIVSSFGAIFLLLLLLIIITVLFCGKKICKKDAARFHPKLDANGNCATGDKISQGYSVQTQVTEFTETSPEQQCLMEKAELCSDQSQCSNNYETLTRTDGCSIYKSIDPLNSTAVLNGPDSALSEPMTLLSKIESVTPQTSVTTQSSSQPTSPQIISPVTTSPQVNVNITFHIGNGSSKTPPFMPSDLMLADCTLPLGEEESFSIPQQEAGKQSLMSVQESTSYSV